VSDVSHITGYSAGSSLDVSLADLIGGEEEELVDIGRPGTQTVTLEGVNVAEIEGPGAETVPPQGITVDDANIGDNYAVAYSPPKVTYYWGKVQKVFSNDGDEPVNKVEIKFLLQKQLSADTSRIRWNFPPVSDVEIVEAKFIGYGPCKPDILMGGNFRFDDEAAKAALEALKF
jgi:hypothetical protein